MWHVYSSHSAHFMPSTCERSTRIDTCASRAHGRLYAFRKWVIGSLLPSLVFVARKVTQMYRKQRSKALLLRPPIGLTNKRSTAGKSSFVTVNFFISPFTHSRHSVKNTYLVPRLVMVPSLRAAVHATVHGHRRTGTDKQHVAAEMPRSD